MNDLLNIAAMVKQTRVLGPGIRAGIWVQGCSLNCPGCIAPDWQEFRSHFLISSFEMSELLLQIPGMDGITISGGEPMLQAYALSRMIKFVRRQLDIDVVCYTGYLLDELCLLNNADIDQLLSEVDVLIDGGYKQALDDNKGLRGSSNQTVHYLSSRLKGVDFNSQPRKTEVHVLEGEAFLVGIPGRYVTKAFDLAKKKMQTDLLKEVVPLKKNV